MTTLMECLTRIEAQPLAHALGWTLLHFCWQGAVVAGMLWWVLRLLHGRPSQARYAAACSALLLLVALPVVTFVQLAQDELAASRVAAIPVYIAASTLVVTATGAAPEPLLTRIQDVLNSSVPWLPMVWLAGVVFFLVRLNVGLLAARRMKSAGAEPVGVELQRAFDRLRVRLGVERAVRLMHSALVEVPTVIGWLRPVVLVPASCLSGLSPMQIEAVLAHELAHVRRHDYLVSVFQSVVEALLFYHPAVWWVSRQVRRERECCCDELAVAVGGDVVAYARALSYLEERRGSVPEFVLGANGGVLTMRIKRLLGRGENAAVSQVAALVVLAVIVGGVGSYWATVAHAQKQRAHAAVALPDEPTESTQSNQLLALNGIQTLPLHPAQQAAVGDADAPLPRGVYKTWLEQDVRWIISDEEAQAYQRLNNSEERDKFIEQFWARRNPNPSSAENEYRDEIYARIAYANQHFAADKPGWSTDRGHIYIVYGKPESIDAHPSGGLLLPPNGSSKEMPPFEVWHYNYIPGIGDHVDLTFVDTCKCGNYNLTIDNLTIDQPGRSGVARETDNTRVALAAKMLAPPVVNGTQQGASSQPADTAERPNPLKRRLSDKERLQEDQQAVAKDELNGVNKTWLAGSASPQTNGPATQTDSAIAGMVVDPTGARVPRAFVTTINTDTGWRMVKQTDNSGNYLLSPLPPGPYIVEVQAGGFQRLLQENVQVKPGQTFNLNLKLTVGGASQSVTITGSPVAAAPPPPPPPVGDDAAKPTGPVRVSTGTAAGMIISKVDPVYPDEARAAHVQGTVVLRAVISKEGTVEKLNVVSGPPELMVSAIDAVRQWKYKPYLLNGEPTEVSTTININFKLSDTIAAQGQRPTLVEPAPGPVRVYLEPGIEIRPEELAGNLIRKVEPVYPAIAKAAHVQGTVVLRTVIAKTGDVVKVEVVSGPPMLTGSAVEAARQWIYKPYLLNGQPTEVETTININFSLADATATQVPTDAKVTALAKAAQEYRDFIAAYPAAPTTADAQARLKQIQAELEQAEAELTMQDAHLSAIRSEYNGEPVRKVGGGVTAPMVIYQVEPQYTPEARKAKAAGMVVVQLIVDEQGLPQNVHVIRGFGVGPDGKPDPKLKKAARAAADGMNQNAVNAVKQYKFKPAMQDGKPVPVELNVEVNFQIF